MFTASLDAPAAAVNLGPVPLSLAPDLFSWLIGAGLQSGSRLGEFDYRGD